MTNPIQSHIDISTMGRTQIMVVVICVLLNIMDGVDILITSFTASSVAEEWGLSNKSLGLILSSGLFGMAAGALFLSPYADKFGRRLMIIISLIIISVGMCLSAYADNYIQLSLLRFFTGLGIGGMIGNINTITAEFSSKKRRDLCVTLVQSGNPVGGLLGGVAAVYLITYFGWRSTFLAAGILSFTLLPLVYWKLPESLAFLISRRPKGALERINKILVQMKYSPVSSLPEPGESDKTTQPIKELFEQRNLANTFLLWSAFFSVMFSFYFVMSWTPKLLVQAGMSASEGISGSIVLNFGGIIGAPLLGYFAARYNLQNLIAGYAVSTGIFMVLFGIISNNFVPALFVSVFLGFFLLGSIIGLYAMAPHVYGVNLRVTGIGYAIGVGRIGAVIAPFIAGYLLDLGVAVVYLYCIFALPMIMSGYAQYKIKQRFV